MINNNIKMAITFVAGVAVGVVASYKVAETKYRNIADAEIESVIETFEKRRTESKETEQNDTNFEDAMERMAEDVKTSKSSKLVDYKKEVERTGYDKMSKSNAKPKKNTKKKEEADEEVAVARDNGDIYVISPDEFNTLDGYDNATFFYSSDNYVLDSEYHVLSDSEISATIGHDPYGHFGEYEEDSVCVRNDNLKCDYEILLSLKTCDEIRED